MTNSKVIIKGNVRMDNTPHFILDGGFVFDNQDEMTIYNFDENRGLIMQFRFTHLETQEISDQQFFVPIKKAKTPLEIIKEGVFISLKSFLNEYYSDFWRGDVYEKFFIDTIGYTNYHTYQKIWSCSYNGYEYKYTVAVSDEKGECSYNIINDDIYSSSGENLGRIDIQPMKPDQNADYEKNLRYDAYHCVHADISSFEEFIEVIGEIPSFFKKHNTEYWQVQEAEKRLRFLGVSDLEIEAFLTKGTIPVVEVKEDGNIIRRSDKGFGTLKGFETLLSYHDILYWNRRSHYQDVNKILRGGLPYLLFRNKGNILMDAYLFVEDLVCEREICQNEMKKDSKQQILTALVFFEDYNYASFIALGRGHEFGSIVIEITDDGPVRVG